MSEDEGHSDSGSEHDDDDHDNVLVRAAIDLHSGRQPLVMTGSNPHDSTCDVDQDIAFDAEE